MRLSILAITLNEKEHLKFWHENHKGLGDEFVMIDTGSYDGTQEIAKGLPVRYYEHRWEHSFASMKNLGMRACQGDWILTLSPDLWIQPKNFKRLKHIIDNAGETKAFCLPCIDTKKFGKLDLAEVVSVPREKIWSDTHCCLFRNDEKLEYRNRVHENINESIIEHYGEEAIRIIDVPRYHHNPDNVYFNRDKLRYYWFLEDYAALERKFWEHGEVLRKKAYDNELSG